MTVPSEKNKTVSFVSSTMKSIVTPSSQSRLLVKLIYCVDLINLLLGHKGLYL